MLTTLQKERLFEIAKWTQTPSKKRTGFRVEWSPGPVRELIELGMVTVKFGSVVLTEKGRREIE